MDARDSVAKTSTSAKKLTYADFLLFPDDGQRHELIDGEHYVTPSPNVRHQQLVVRLATELANYLKAHPIGEVFVAPLDCVMSDVDIVEPDLLVVLADQTDILTPKHVRGAPAIVVEILSPSTRNVDQRIKRSLYDRAGVREYWMVDPQMDAIVISRRSATRGLQEGLSLTLDGAHTLMSPLLPGFELSLLDFFRRVRPRLRDLM